MLHAILNRKLGRSIDSQEVHWSQLFRASEDSLTSTIFGNLLHLPTTHFWRILKNACYGEGLAVIDEKILSVEFWPRWSAYNTANETYVEPDVFIRTENTDIIIEAKRFDEGQQLHKQWENELIAYENEYSEEGRDAILIALGGLHTIVEEEIKSKTGNTCRVLKCKWERILSEVKRLSKETQTAESEGHNPIRSICLDLIKGFELHGFYTGDWFEETTFENLLPIRSESFLQLTSLNLPHLIDTNLLEFDTHQIREESLQNLSKWKI